MIGIVEYRPFLTHLVEYGSNAPGGLVGIMDKCVTAAVVVAPSCSKEAIQLIPKSEGLRRVPPANAAEQMAFMAETRGFV